MPAIVTALLAVGEHERTARRSDLGATGFAQAESAGQVRSMRNPGIQ